MDSAYKKQDISIYPMRKMNINKIVGEDISDLLDLASLALRIHVKTVTPTEEKNLTSIFQSLNGRIQCFMLEIESIYINSRQYLWPLLSQLDGIQRLAIEIQGVKPINYLKNKNLTMISNYISRLTNLTHFSLNTTQCYFEDDDNRDNQSNSNFSLGIDKLENLECLELLLNESKLDPIQLLQVSQAIGKALKLSSLVLRLRTNDILDPRACHLSSCVSKLKQLNVLELDLENNLIQQFGMIYLFNVISQFSQIKHIDISLAYNEIHCKDIMNQVPLDFSSLKCLEVMKLNLEGNKLFGIGVEYLIKGLSTLPSLLTLVLNIKKTCFSISKDNKYEAYFSKLKNLSQLSLTLDDNELENSFQFLQAGLSQLHQLESYNLSINNNQVDFIGMTSIYQVLSSFINLRSLSLKFNLVSLKCPVDFQWNLDSLEKLIALEELTLEVRECSLCDPQMKEIFKKVSKLQNLKSLTLILKNNKIGFLELVQISDTIQQLINLNHLNLTLSSSLLRDDSLQFLASSITKLQNLKSFKGLGLTKKLKTLIQKQLIRLVILCDPNKN